jgi:hypothetical protein
VLLVVISVVGDRVGAEQEGGIHRYRCDAPADLAEQQRQLDEAVSAATCLLGQRNSEQVGCRELAPEARVVAHVAGLELGQMLGCDSVFEELTRHLGDRLLFFGEREVHALPRRAELV